MKVYLNPGHDRDYDSGACNPNDGMREADVVWEIGVKAQEYLENAGCEVMMRQSDNLCWDSSYEDRQDAAVCPEANDWGADIFVSIHCNACDSHEARGTEVECYQMGGAGEILAQRIQTQLVNSLGTIDRGVKEMPGFLVLRHTDMPSVLIETAFIDNDADAEILRCRRDEIAAAIARGITDYACAVGADSEVDSNGGNEVDNMSYESKYFSEDEMRCHGDGCCDGGAYNVKPRLLELLDQLRENVGGPITATCMYRCPEHNAEVKGVPNSQHVLGEAADLACPDWLTMGEFQWYCEQLPFDGIGVYTADQFIHVDVREGGVAAGYRWEG